MRGIVIRMKRILVIVILLLFSCIALACRPTPQSPPIIGRQEDIVESAEAVAFQAIEAPAHVYQVYAEFPKLRVTMDAEVVVPQATAYTLLEVSPQIFSDAEILSLIQYFMNDVGVKLYAEWNIPQEEWARLLNEV